MVRSSRTPDRASPSTTAARVYAAILILVAAVLAAVLFVVDPWRPSLPELWQAVALAAGVAASRKVAIELILRGHSQRLTLTEVPLVLGLAYLPGPAVVASFAAVIALVGAFRRDDPAKWTLNTAVGAVTAAVSALVIVGVDRVPALPTWGTTLIGCVVGLAAGTGAMLFGVVLNQNPRRVAATVRFGGNVYLVGVLTSAAAVAAVELVGAVQWGGLLVAVLAVVLGLGYWAYSGLLHEQRDLGLVNEMSLEVARAGRGADEGMEGASDEDLLTALELTREQLNAKRVVLERSAVGGRALVAGLVPDMVEPDEWPPLPLPLPIEPDPRSSEVHRLRAVDLQPHEREPLDVREADEILVARLRGADGDLGLLEVHDRHRPLRGSGAADLRLVETLASHLATALDNQRLLAQLRHDAYHDRLTGLRNRLGFREGARERLDGRVGSAAVVVVDLGLLESVNDALGHACGDAIVEEAGGRLRAALPDGSLLARLEGDTFAALLDDVDETTATAAAERLRARLAAPYAGDELALECNPVVGVALTSVEPTPDVEQLLQRADVALQAARRGGARVRHYLPSMGQGFARRSQLVTQFRGALESGEIDVHLQPQVTLRDQEVIGVEVLVRWQHPELGTLDPEEFVAVIEATGLIDALTTFVLDRALAQCRRWLDRDVRLSVAVNVSVRNLADATFPERVREALERHGVPATLLVLELTESAVMSDPARALPVLRALHATGLRIAVDDFGTGYSSLSYLRRLPVDEVKIDKSFVLGMESDLSDLAVVRAIVDLGHSLDLRVVAEGVEQDGARDALRDMGCDVAQGYLVSRPLPPERFDAWLHTRTVRERDVRDEPVLRLVR